jgi:hypothetical protein
MILTKLPSGNQRRVQRSTVRRPSMRLQLEDLESRVLLAGNPAQLIIQVQPTQTALGTAMFPAMQVAVADVTSQTVTTDKSAVLLTIVSGPGGGSLTLNGTPVAGVTVNAVNGVATFNNINFTTTGIYQLGVNDGNLAGTASNFFNVTAAATKLAFVQQPSTIVVGQPISPAIAAWVEDAGGNLVTSDRSAVTLSIVPASGQPGGTLTGTTTVNAITGVAIFNGISVSKPGSYKLIISDGTLTTASSNTFTVTAAGPTNLSFAQQPLNTPLGVVLPTITVNVNDASGNIVATDNSLVTLSIGSGPAGGTISGVTTVNAVNGVATFTNLSISPIGNYSLRATDGNLSAAVSSNFVVFGDPANLVFAKQPAPGSAGTVLPPVVVNVTDSAGDIVPTDSSVVTLTLNTTAGTLIGTTTVNAVNGVATFDNLSLSPAGTYTLTAADGTLATANSSSFIINGAAAQLAFSGTISATSINTAISPAVVVKVEDIFGNLVVDSSAIITISIASGPAGGTLSGTTTVTAVNGMASFSNLLLSAAGTYTLTAASGALTSALSSSVDVLPPPSKVVFTTQPSEVATGATMFPAVVVSIENALGQVAPNDKSSVTLAVLSGPDGGTIGGTTTVAAVNGVATFSNLTFTVPGDYTLVAFDGALAADTSISFTVTQAPTRLQWILQPQYTIQAGDTLPPMTVWVENRNKELVSSSHAVVTLTISSGPTGGSLTLNGTVAANASTNANHGIATFSGLSFTKIGTYVLNAASTGLTAAKSEGFVVIVDGSSSHLMMVSNPTSTVVGKTFSSNVVVKIADFFGNVISSGTSPVTLYISSGSGGLLTGSTTINATRGVATFGNLKISQAGSYVISASDAALPNPSPTSFSLTVTPVISSVKKPGTSSFYLAGTDFTLSTQLLGTVKSVSPWTGTASLVTTGGEILPTTSQVTSGGKVSLAVAGRTAGTYAVRLMYSGDVNHLGAASPVFNVVVGRATSTKVSRTVTGTTLDLDVSVGASGTSKPTGVVQLYQNGVANETASVNTAGHAIFSDLSRTAGSYTITAVYEGDDYFRTSSSAAFTVNIGLKSATTLSANKTTLGRGDALTLTALVVDPANNVNIPTGNVKLLENGTLNQMVALNATTGQATISLTPTVGKHAYSFAYQGDTSYLVSSSKTLNVTVGREATTVTLSVVTPASTFGDIFAVKAQVSAANGTTIARTGIVALKDGGNTIATLSLNSSSNATFSLTPTAGTHAYSVAYMGDSNFGISVSTAQALTVAKDTTTISSAGGGGAILGIFVFVHPVNATASIPTGVVQLKDNGVTIMTLTLDSAGQGTFHLTPPSGDHSYTWAYLGDSNFASSASTSPLDLTVP